MLDYLKSVIEVDRKNGLLLRFSAHLTLFFRAASFELKVIFSDLNIYKKKINLFWKTC